jgi:uncharacterized protein YjbI with pentapeptide repeats
MSANEQYYRVLGLEPGATLEEINQAYKDLAFIWHPDRIPKDNPRLQQKANEFLKEINTARDHLRSYLQQTTKVTPPPASSPSPSYRPPRPHSSDTRYWGADFKKANLKEKDLSGRDFRNANFTGANLSDAFMHKVNLSGAILFQANLFRANLLQANLSHANLREANLVGADLSGSDLSGADLRGARMKVGDRILVKLTGARLTGAIMPDGTVHQ